MSGLLKYVKESELGFDERPLNTADALVLSWLSYFNFPLSTVGEKGVKISDVGSLPSDMFDDAFNPKKSKKLFNRLKKSPRFGGITLFNFIRETDEKAVKQFAAVTMRLYEGTYFISFRGTDPSFVGWKENFDLIYRYPLPSQTAALEYVKAALVREKGASFYLGGHSKGGNMAVYAAAKTEEKERLLGVYNFDGPGFLCDVNCDIAQKVVPCASFVGMLLEKGRNFSIVKSKNVSLLQHDPFSWKIKHGDFKKAKRRSDASVRLERSVNRWVDEMSLEERERLVSIVYTALLKLDTRNFNVFFKTVIKQALALGKEHRGLNESDRAFFDEKVRRLKKILKKG